MLTRHREEDDLLVGPLFGGIVADRNTAGSDFTRLLGVGNVATAGESVSRQGVLCEFSYLMPDASCNLREDHVAGEAVAGFEGSHVG